MFKALSQRLDDELHQRNGGFGAAFAPGFGLPEVPLAVHSGEVAFSGTRATKEPESIQALGLSRLVALRPQDEKLKTRLKLIIAEVATVLEKADGILEECAQESWTILERKHAAILKVGRELSSKIPKLQSAVVRAEQTCSESDKAKRQRLHDLEAYQDHKKNLSQWTNDEEHASADAAINKAREAYRIALELDWENQQELATAESALATAKTNLEEASKIELGIQAEMSGMPFFDPQTGLSSQANGQG
jgi:hypothetical protein